MWIKKVMLSVWFRGFMACLLPPAGCVLLIFHPISQLAKINYVLFLVLCLFILHFLINLVFPFAVSWIKAILAVLPALCILGLFGLVALSASAMYGGDTMARTFRDLLLLFLGATVSIIFARMGGGLGAWLEKIPKAKSFPFFTGQIPIDGLLMVASIFSIMLIGIFIMTLLATWQKADSRKKLKDTLMETSRWSITQTPETSRIYAIRKDKQGTLWIGGEYNRLQRFDGKSWQGYFENEDISKIEFDRKGRLWVSSYSSPNIFLIDENGPQKTTATGTVLETVDREGRVWYCVDLVDFINYRLLEEENPEQVFNPQNNIWLGFGPDGKLWASHFENGFQISSKSENEAWIIHDFSSTFSPYASAEAITFDRQGFPWFVVHDFVVDDLVYYSLHYSGKSWEIENIPSPSDGSLKALLFDQKGRLWVAFSDTKTGLAVRENGKWTFFSTYQVTERGTDGVYALYLDDTGLLWFGTGGTLVSFNTLGPLPAAKPLPDDLANIQQETPVASVISGIAALIMVLLTLRRFLSRSAQG